MQRRGLFNKQGLTCCRGSYLAQLNYHLVHCTVAGRSDDVTYYSGAVESEAGNAFRDMVRVLNSDYISISTEDAGDFESVPLSRDTRIYFQTGEISLDTENGLGNGYIVPGSGTRQPGVFRFPWRTASLPAIICEYT